MAPHPPASDFGPLNNTEITAVLDLAAHPIGTCRVSICLRLDLELGHGEVMPTVVEQIQVEAVSNEVPVSQLLRRVKLAAVKLKLEQVATWVAHEMDGYGDAEIPDYRRVSGSPVAHNPYNGWIPIQSTAQFMETLRITEIGQSIASLEALLVADGMLFFSYTPQQIEILNRMGSIPLARMGIHIDRSAIVGLLDRVRGKVLDWSLDLERAGILGEGVSFTQQEVEKASGVTVQIDSFNGTLNTNTANGSNARINNNSTDNSTNIIQQDLERFEELKRALESIDDGVERRALITQVDDMQGALGTNRFLSAYQKFVSSASDHITVITPFLPWLGSLIAAAT